jgi:hypothetical protein
VEKIALKLITAPASEPVTLAEVKLYLRIDGSDDDTMLNNFITVARQIAEEYTNRKFINQTWDLWMDRFPSQVNFDALAPDTVTQGKLSEYISVQNYIEIPYYPLSSVTYLKTYDDDGTDYTMTSTDYIVDTYTEPSRISLKNSTVWPSTFLRPVNGIQIRFVAGYGTLASAVPYPIKQAIMELVGKFYSSRGCDETKLPSVAMALLGPYRVVRI